MPISIPLCWLLLPGLFHSTGSEGGLALLEAARRNDVAAVRRLLDDGVDVNTRSPYGATALSFACDKGHLEVARLLIDEGADVNVADTFYRATPYYWALAHEHLDLLQLLVENGAPADERGLLKATREGHAGLVGAIAAQQGLDEDSFRRALTLARQVGREEVARVLEEAGFEPLPEARIRVEPGTLDLYSGSYRNRQIGVEITFRPDDGKLRGSVPGQPEITYTPRDEKTFESVEYPGITVIFHRRESGASVPEVPTITLRQGDSTFVFDRVARLLSAPGEREPAPASSPAARVVVPAPWPGFRGAFAAGVADGQHPPLRWDGERRSNLRFKTPVPGLGHSSPVVWGDSVYLTTAVGQGEEPPFRHGQYGDVDSVEEDVPYEWRLICFDRDTGEIRWNRVAHRGLPRYHRHLKASHANCTPATDGERVVVNFGAEGLFCFDAGGNRLWRRDLGPMDAGWFYDADYQWGFGSSPVIHEDLVIVQADVQADSFIAAFRLEDGKEMWRADRDEIPSWGTPTVVVSKDRIQVVTNSSRRVYGYDVATGNLLWSLTGNSEVTVATPVAAHGLIYFTGGYHPIQPIYAVKVQAEGDITPSEARTSGQGVAWLSRRGGTYMPTPIVVGDLLYTCSNSGILTCYDARTGERRYRERIAEGRGGGYTASPVAAEGRLYFTGEDGDVHVVEAGPTYRLLATNPVGEVCLATPAISGGIFFVRGVDHLFGFGRPLRDEDE